MKIAIPVRCNNQIDDHFGHCEYYSIYSISESGEIADKIVIESEQGCGCKSGIAAILANDGVKVMLAGGIGAGAINKLNNAGIEVLRGCAGDADSLVKEYLNGLIKDSGSSCQTHEHHNGEGHQHGHTCNH
jgi:predicted Fe-Mo cluster-binding NifX family protein